MQEGNPCFSTLEIGKKKNVQVQPLATKKVRIPEPCAVNTWENLSSLDLSVVQFIPLYFGGCWKKHSAREERKAVLQSSLAKLPALLLCTAILYHKNSLLCWDPLSLSLYTTPFLHIHKISSFPVEECSASASIAQFKEHSPFLTFSIKSKQSQPQQAEQHAFGIK